MRWINFSLLVVLGGCGASQSGNDGNGAAESAGSAGEPSSGGSGSTDPTGAGGSSNPIGGAGGSATGTGGAPNTGSAGSKNVGGGGTNAMAGDGGRGSAKCTAQAKTALPARAPVLVPGEWTDITPKDLVPLKGTNQTMIAQGIALDPCDASTLYWGSTPFNISKGGLFKSTDAGSTWKKLGKFDAPLHVRIDPGNNQHLYVGDGVRGATQGFWVSNDGGDTWTMPQAFKDICTTVGIPSSCGMLDIYDVSVDPSDFKHVLLSFHSPWNWGDSNKGSGVLESKDGGDTWIPHGYPNQFGYGTLGRLPVRAQPRHR